MKTLFSVVAIFYAGAAAAAAATASSSSFSSFDGNGRRISGGIQQEDENEEEEEEDHRNDGDNVQRFPLSPGKECLLFKREIEWEDGHKDEECWCCLLDFTNGDEYEFRNGGGETMTDCIKGIIKEEIDDTGIISGAAVLKGAGLVVEESIDRKNKILTLVAEKEASFEVKPIPENDSRHYLARRRMRRNLVDGPNINPHRKLSHTKGTLETLVIRVVAPNTPKGGEVASVAQLKDDIFEDSVCLKTQYAACSKDQLVIEPANEGTSGIVTINIDASPSDGKEALQQAALRKALQQYGSLWEKFDLVMFCQPGGSGDWVAYAYINSFDSYYNNPYCRSVSAQLHEVGHSLGLGHSNEGSQEYGDNTCTMGFALSMDDGPRRCFNAAKNYQLGWFDLQKEAYDPSENTEATFVMNGIEEYQDENSAGKLITLRLIYKSNLYNPDDYYVGYNRANGANSGAIEARDKIVIVQNKFVIVPTPEGGLAWYGESWKMSELSVGESYTIANYAESENDVVVKYESVANGLRDATVSVKMLTYDPDCVRFDLEITTDEYGVETYWSMIETSTNKILASVNRNSYGSYKKYFVGPSDFPGLCLTHGKQYTFQINDVWGDGMCCQVGQGGFVGRLSGKELFSGGNFEKTWVETFTVPEGCKYGETEFKLRLKIDKYGQETTWKLRVNGDTTEIAKGGPQEYSSDNEYEERVCLIGGKIYEFIIEDEYGDGLCCIDGQGFYKVYLNKVLEFEGGDFNWKESKTFFIDIPETQTDRPTSTSPTTAFPTFAPTASPKTSVSPSGMPSDGPSEVPSVMPSSSPSAQSSFKPSLSSSPTPFQFVLEGNRVYVGCDAYVFLMNIDCNILNEDDPDQCLFRFVRIGLSSSDNDGFTFIPNSLNGQDINYLDPDDVCISSGLATIPMLDRIEGNNIPPIPLNTSEGCAETEIPDGMFVVKGEITNDGSANIKISYSQDYGSTFYTDLFTEMGLYLAVFEDNYVDEDRRLEQNSEATGLIDKLNDVVEDPLSFTFPPCLKSTPSGLPSGSPSVVPSLLPSVSPSGMPSDGLSGVPSEFPSLSPSESPNSSPTSTPTAIPTASPTRSPMTSPTTLPSYKPSTEPSILPSTIPSTAPTASPTGSPTASPTANPTSSPTISPTASPTVSPTKSPSYSPSSRPSESPTESPTVSRSYFPSSLPSQSPSTVPSNSPSSDPSEHPSYNASFMPSSSPSNTPSKLPSLIPSESASIVPSEYPSHKSSVEPSILPITIPSTAPTASPTHSPTASLTETSPSEPSIEPNQACINSAEFNCSEYLKNSESPGKKCGKIIEKGKRVKDLCPELCKEHLCTCVDRVKKFSIKGKEGGENFTCANLIGKTNCNERTGDGFGVKSICPNKCNNIKKCVFSTTTTSEVQSISPSAIPIEVPSLEASDTEPSQTPSSELPGAPSSEPFMEPNLACINSAEIDCSKYLKNSKKPGNKCDKMIKEKGKRVKALCPELCKEHLCTCVDSVKKFSIKGNKGGEKFTCANLIGKTNCNERTGDGFVVKSICPNKCNNIKKCVR